MNKKIKAIDEEERSSIGVLDRTKDVIKIVKAEAMRWEKKEIGIEDGDYVLESIIQDVGIVKEIWIRKDYSEHAS